MTTVEVAMSVVDEVSVGSSADVDVGTRSAEDEERNTAAEGVVERTKPIAAAAAIGHAKYINMCFPSMDAW